MLNIFSLAAVFLPIAAAFLWRIHVEETVLREAFGTSYRRYTTTTPRLLPWIY